MKSKEKTYKPLDDLLESSGMKLEQISEKSGIPYSTLYKWRINPRRIKAIELGLIANVTHINLDEYMRILKKFKLELDKLKRIEEKRHAN